jgi:hypothetical protein
LWTVASARIPERVRRPVGAACRAAAVVLVVLVCSQTVTAGTQLLDSPDLERAQYALGAFADRAVPDVPPDRPVLYRWVGPRGRWVGDGFALELEQAGRQVRVDDDGTNALKFGAHRVVAKPDASMRAVWVASGLWVDDFRRAGAGRELASWDPLSPVERREVNDRLRHLRQLFDDARRPDLVAVVDDGGSLWPAKDFPGVTQEELDRVDQLLQRGEPAAVFLFDRADQAPLPARP